MQRLKEKILTRKATIGVIGLGYVGLPLAMEFCRAGYNVVGFDTDQHKVEALKAGKSYIPDVPSETVAAAVQAGRFAACSEFDRLSEVGAVSICVPTPLRKTKDPDVSYIIAAVRELKTRLHRPMVVVLESTTYPGTTEELLQTEIQVAGFRVGTDVYLCFSPERVDPGNPVYHTKNTPKVIGGVTPACTEMGALLYSQIVDQVIPVSSAKAAEMVKLLENTFRAVNIALVNEMALMCQRMGINIWEVIEAAATKPFGFMPFYPGPGIGGHCIPLDPMYLSWKAKMYNFYNRFIELASDINGNMPYHVVQRIGEVLNFAGKPISQSVILCLGLAYKKNVNDNRESPSLDVVRLLRYLGAHVQYSDPFVPVYKEEAFEAESVALTPERIAAADCVVLLTDHSAFDYSLIAQHARRIVDTRNAFKGMVQPNIFRIGTPLPRVEEWQEMNRGGRGHYPTDAPLRPKEL
ncbi:MAG: nucleotide sugar dehydrogenase [Bacillota bacterium]